MAYIRRLPSGAWQATIRGADGRKHTCTDRLKKVVKDWAADEETKVAQGKWRDPRLGRQTFATWAERWFAARVVEDDTRRGDRSVLNNHLLPHWKDWQLQAISALDVQEWVKKLQKAGVGPSAVRRSYNLFARAMKAAVVARVLAESPCADIGRPATPPKLVAWFTRDEVDRIRAQLDRRHRGHSVMTELMCCSGLRWGEAAAVVGAERGDGNPVDWLRSRIRIVGSLTQNGRWKEYPKTSKSRREVPLEDACSTDMAALLVGRPPDSRIFVSPRSGSNLDGANWRTVWYRAIDAVNAAARAAKVPEVPRLDPHDCRHTCASWLVQEGVPLYEVQALLGHESVTTTQRYAHLQPDAHGRVEDAWRRILAHQRRTARGKGVMRAR